MRLELLGVTKRFGTLLANNHIDVVVEPGEIHCLLGENGAGKSTLMNVLYGLYQPDDGEIRMDDRPVTFGSPDDAIRAGIGMVHQHFMLVPVFTVAENVMLGQEDTRRGGLLDIDAARRKVREVSERYGFNLDPDAVVEDLPVGVQQRVEIVKALARRADVLILDEPTAVLTPQETDELIGIMRQLKADGTSIVFITHKLREVRAIADTITVIRGGRVVGTAEPTSSESDLASMMVGRAVSLTVAKAAGEVGDVVLSVRDLIVTDDADRVVVDEVSVDVHAGEILAVAGVQGNGQTELGQALLGLQSNVSGEASLDGQQLAGRSPRQILDAGVGFVPEDRTTDGIVGDFSVAENLVLDLYASAPYSSGISMNGAEVRENARRQVDDFDIRTHSIHAPARTLSGGNQQKVVVAREFSRSLRLLIASQPTRGLDVGSIEFVHRRIIEERDRGTAVILVSTELDEVAALADRVAVMYRGSIVGIVPGDTDRDVLGLMMAGVRPEDARSEAAAHPSLAEHPDTAVDPGSQRPPNRGTR